MNWLLCPDHRARILAHFYGPQRQALRGQRVRAVLRPQYARLPKAHMHLRCVARALARSGRQLQCVLALYGLLRPQELVPDTDV